MSPAVSSFTPSRAGLLFPNEWPPGTPALAGLPAAFKLPGGATLDLNDASNGLCGGMALTVVDYYVAGRVPPRVTTPPAAGTPLFQHLVRRLIDSWDLPAGVFRYVELMTPCFPTSRRCGCRPGAAGPV